MRVCAFAVARSDMRLEPLRGHLAPGEQRPFIGVRADQHGGVVESTGLVQLVLIAHDDLAIDDWPGAGTWRPESDALLDLIRGKRTRRLDVAGADPGEDRLPGGFRHLQRRNALPSLLAETRRRKTAATLGNRTGEEALCRGRGREHADGDSTGGLTENRHTRGIATETRNVLLDPLQPRDLVAKPVVARSCAAFLTELRMREETEHTDAVGDAHDHDALLRQPSAIVGGAAGLAAKKPPP